MSVATFLEVVFFGGQACGGTASLDSSNETVKVGNTIYADSYFIDDNGRAIFYCRKGEGKLSRKYVDSLFEGDSPF